MLLLKTKGCFRLIISCALSNSKFIRSLRTAALLLSLPSLVSCASYFIRKDCEKMNWYQIGYDAALRGERISNDEVVNKCRKVEAEISESQLDVGFKAGMSRYCQPDGAYQTGKNGDTFNSDFCDSGQLPILRKKHDEGLRNYCAEGLQAGLSGRKYKNVCNAAQEKTFLPEYRKGRKKYLQGMLQNAESKVAQERVDWHRLTAEKTMVSSQLSFLPYVKAGENDPYSAQRSSLNNKIWNLDSQINSKSAQIQKLEGEIDSYKKEIVTLD